MNPTFIETAQYVIQTELDAVQEIMDRLDQDFSASCEAIMNCRGKVILMGMGKSGHIASKIAATFASTGTPAFFIHPGEAGHGDLGMIDDKDLVIAISYSGENDELLTLIPIIKRLNVPLIVISGQAQSTLVKQADFFLDISVSKEACPHNLTPTSSTTTTLVLGDALAVALLSARNFSSKDFARSHPAGALGRRLLTYVSDIMCQGQDLPCVQKNTHLKESIIEMSNKKLGAVMVVNGQKTLLGIFTDGDLRRALEKHNNIDDLSIDDVMSTNFQTIAADTLASEALMLMEKHRINALPVVNTTGDLVGIINMHTLLDARII